MRRILLVVMGLLVLCVPVFADDEQTVIRKKEDGTYVLRFWSTASQRWVERPHEPDPLPDYLGASPDGGGWCFELSIGGETVLYWCNALAWSEWDDSNWEDIADPHIMLLLDHELDSGEFISTDDRRFYAHLETELIPIEWKGVGNPEACGVLGWTSSNTSSAVIFNPDPAPNGRDYHLSYLISASVATLREFQGISQDDISKLRQQYVDFNRQRWYDATPTIPARNEFRASYSTANYNFDDYGQGRDLIVMNMGVTAERICRNEVDSLDNPDNDIVHIPEMSSGYREPDATESRRTPRSLHQWGYALDFNPHPPHRTRGGREAMVRRTRNLLGLAGYDTAIHALDQPDEHIHIEQQTIAQGGSTTQ